METSSFRSARSASEAHLIAEAPSSGGEAERGSQASPHAPLAETLGDAERSELIREVLRLVGSSGLDSPASHLGYVRQRISEGSCNVGP